MRTLPVIALLLVSCTGHPAPRHLSADPPEYTLARTATIDAAEFYEYGGTYAIYRVPMLNRTGMTAAVTTPAPHVMLSNYSTGRWEYCPGHTFPITPDHVSPGHNAYIASIGYLAHYIELSFTEHYYPFPDELWAVPTTEDAAPGELVRLVVFTGTLTAPLTAVNGIALSLPPCARYQPNSFNVGAPGNPTWYPDGAWRADDLFIQYSDSWLVPQDSKTGQRFLHVNVTPQAMKGHPGQGELFSVILSFSEPGEYILAPLESVDGNLMTFYSDTNAQMRTWGWLNQDHAGISVRGL